MMMLALMTATIGMMMTMVSSVLLVLLEKGCPLRSTEVGGDGGGAGAGRAGIGGGSGGQTTMLIPTMMIMSRECCVD